ncbi:MAG: site-specific DNA-methyltransferase, partial [Candidatus Cloacimonetes bacterium]|nr:site-specific DNA-methyltransferase [Candidatus Cloacimonadota bacterium]
MLITDTKHKDKRILIPSNEEAGMENANPLVKEKTKAEYPKNPVVTRGQDPELFWLGKYGKDENDDILNVDIRSLYRHEHISPITLINNLYSYQQAEQKDIFDTFGNGIPIYEEDKIPAFYKHHDNWSNRLILGDSLLVMNSMLEREGMAGQVQMIYIDPPYGIKYGGNWQIKINNRDVKDGKDEHLSGEAEQIKAYRDTWELGIHSYLSYLRDRLVVAKELLTESGSCFVQISDENVHLVRCLMDEVFGSENFICEIVFQKTGSETSDFLPAVYDYIVFYAKNKSSCKFKPLYTEKSFSTNEFNQLIDSNGVIKGFSTDDKTKGTIPPGWHLFKSTDLNSRTGSQSSQAPFVINGKTYYPRTGASWRTSVTGLEKLYSKKRILLTANTPRYIHYFDDFPYSKVSNIWNDLMGATDRYYVVQTNVKALLRCILMTTDPGDLVFDPTCGSGTTAYVAEQWGRRWITIDTSRIALNIAKTRLMTATYPYYQLYDEAETDIRHGFKYKTVPHITLKSLANDEPPETETLYDQPLEDKKRFRVSGPFTVETLQSLDILPIDHFESDQLTEADFLQRVKEQLKASGVVNGLKQQRAKFIRLDELSGPYLHLAGYYNTEKGECKAYIHLGPKFSTVSKASVSEASKECRQRGDADWLIILFFSIEDTVESGQITTSMGSFELTKVRMQDDLMQDGLLKKDKKAASFVTIGEPDITVATKDGFAQVKIEGIDIYDPIKDEVSVRNAHDIAYWMVDDDYDGSNFIVKQIFFCGGDKDEFEKWKKKLDNMATETARQKANHTLKIDIDIDAWDRLYGLESHPIKLSD